MSIINSEFLREKLIERRALEFAKSIRGIKTLGIERIGSDDFSQHRNLLAKHANLNSLPKKMEIE
jgi:hypothetical protein